MFSIKNLTNFQLNYFYDYFKCECLAEDLASNQEYYEDKEIEFEIYKNIKRELKQRINLGFDYSKLH